MFDVWQGVINSIYGKTAFSIDAFRSFEQKSTLYGMRQKIQECWNTQTAFKENT